MSINQFCILYLALYLIFSNAKTFLAQKESKSGINTFNDIDCGYKGPSQADSDNKNDNQQFTVAGPGEFRWMVIVQITTPVTTRHNWCSGALINSQWVLTAAHCTLNLDNGTQFDPKMLTVVAGVYNLAKTGEEEKSTRMVRNVAHIEVHDSYFFKSDVYDMSLLRLSSPLEMNISGGSDHHLNAICLPKVLELHLDQIFMGRQCIVTGWDDILPYTIELTDDRPLLRVNTPIISNEECAKQHKGHMKNGLEEKIFDSMLCTGGKSVENRVQFPSTCRLLPGGPVACYDPLTYQWTMVAVNSGTYTTNCATKRLPDVNVAIDHITILWIKNTLKKHSAQ